MKGVILAGGAGTRLYPLTQIISKQLLPIYDKPLIHYPLATLMAAQIREILIITSPKDHSLFRELFGTGESLGVSIDYAIQDSPKGIPDAFIIAEQFLAGDSVCLVLGDNIFFGPGLGRQLVQYHNVQGAQIFGYHVSDPERYGIATVNSIGEVTDLSEKPKNPDSNIAITGLYFFDNSVTELSKHLSPGKRGETEIIDILSAYHKKQSLELEILPRGSAWLDTGTFESMNDASNFVRVLEERQGLKMACLEEIAWRNSWITTTDLLNLASKYSNPLGDYLRILTKTK